MYIDCREHCHTDFLRIKYVLIQIPLLFKFDHDVLIDIISLCVLTCCSSFEVVTFSDKCYIWWRMSVILLAGYIITILCVNTLRLRQKGRHFADDVFKGIFLNGNLWISLKYVPGGPINNIPSLVQIMAWCCPGDKPLSEPMMVSLLMHLCITRPQWVNQICPEALVTNMNQLRLKCW